MRELNRKTWIVVADGGHARILLNTHRDEGVTELPLENGHDSASERAKAGPCPPHPGIQTDTGNARRRAILEPAG